jgi:hypothetical protein
MVNYVRNLQISIALHTILAIVNHYYKPVAEILFLDKEFSTILTKYLYYTY